MSLKPADSLDRLDSWQQRRPALAIPVAVIKKFSDDGADRLGVQIAYCGFFSIFDPTSTQHLRLVLPLPVHPPRSRPRARESGSGHRDQLTAGAPDRSA